MVSTNDLLATARLLVARHGGANAVAFAVDGLDAMIESGQNALIPDWKALHALVSDVANGELTGGTITVH